MNMQARNAQIAAARRRQLALRQQGFVPGGAQQGNLAGCGMNYNQGGWPNGGPGQAWTPIGQFQSLPNLAPPVANLMGPGTTLRQYLAPCSIIVQLEALGASTNLEISAAGGAIFWGLGLRSLNDPNTVIVNSIETGSIDYDLIPCDGVDSAYWATDDCFCPFPIGCFTNVSPLRVEFSAFGTPSTRPFLNLTVVGTRDGSLNDCGFWPAGYPQIGPGPGGGFGPGFTGPVDPRTGAGVRR